MFDKLAVFIYILCSFAVCKLDSQGFTVVIEGKGKLVENDLSNYNFESDKGVLKYQINNNEKCVIVKYQNRSFWEFEDQYPRAVILSDNGVKIECNENHYYQYIYSNDNLKLSAHKKPIEKSEEPSEIGVECGDYEVFAYYKEGEPLKTIYYFKSNCEQILYNQNTLWKSDGSEYPNSMNYKENKIVLTFNDNLIVYEKEGNNWNSSNATLSDIDTKSLRGSGDVSNYEEYSNKKEKLLRHEAITDELGLALALVLIIAIISMVIVMLILLLAFGFTYLSNKKAKKMANLMPVHEVMTVH
ncbi:putative integral membrane protein [Theileria parva strain Muguga]|uniref:Bulb-type lectin domain-containing protein n=1 Tax=Theileria parva TaxID=5875 RepID=Q4N3K3_THEPA|nr:putative integral membrane protein [Theileria parva strain Muguga]EAN31376.1 putative integral membrane protein [Theileria parva strain Muguga]|eukprot:XP_763659.1 hypothetical protein [Theileria parva strain Muguga]